MLPRPTAKDKVAFPTRPCTAQPPAWPSLFGTLLLGLALVSPPAARGAFLQAAGPPASANTAILGTTINALTGVPLPRVLVRLNASAMLTDHEGRFHFDGVPGPVLALAAEKPGFYLNGRPAPSSQSLFSEKRTAAPLILRMYPEALITGSAADAQDQPIPHLPIVVSRLISGGSGTHLVPIGGTETDSHGEFRIPVPPGEFRLDTAFQTAPDAAQATLPLRLPADSSLGAGSLLRLRSGEEHHFDLRPAFSKTFLVTARLDGDTSLGYPTITARASNGTLLQCNLLPSGKPGETRFRLPAGTYQLDARIRTQFSTQQALAPITITTHDEEGLVLHFTAVPALRVELQLEASATPDKGPPTLESFNLTLQSTDFGTDQMYATIPLQPGPPPRNSPGFPAVPGSYRLRSMGGGSEWFVKKALYAGTDILGGDLLIASGSGTVPLRIVASRDTASVSATVKVGSSLSSASIYFIANGPSASPVLETTSSQDGSLDRFTLPPGSYTIYAFEQAPQLDFTDPAALEQFSVFSQSVLLKAGDAPRLELQAIPLTEIEP